MGKTINNSRNDPHACWDTDYGIGILAGDQCCVPIKNRNEAAYKVMKDL